MTVQRSDTLEETKPLLFVYYCSGHGYGHATRVSAFARHLLRLTPPPIVHIVSSAPKHVFADSVALGAMYRNAVIDPVIVQPLAYRVDREKSIVVLKDFLAKKQLMLEHEAQWLKEVGADCVLSDAAFLGCAAANIAGIPSVLITNFTFDSVYSYLSTPFVDDPPAPVAVTPSQPLLAPDVPIPHKELQPLVDQLHAGYRYADLLLRLPGAIPIPSFSVFPHLPSPDWVDLETKSFTTEVVAHLQEPPLSHYVFPSLPFSTGQQKALPRLALSAPLLVRSPNPSVYTKEGRSRLLDSLGVPPHRHDPTKTKILIVSFGGQVFHKPSHNRTPSRGSPPQISVSTPPRPMNGASVSLNAVQQRLSIPDPDALAAALQSIRSAPPKSPVVGCLTQQRSRAGSFIKIPGAPPAILPPAPVSPATVTIPILNYLPPTPKQEEGNPYSFTPSVEDVEEVVHMLPDDSWIAVVCGVSKDWGREDGEELPDCFYVAPKDVYMPDLTAVADVLLGKLGYGTVSECVDACTPFVYVPRPLFIEEHGLRLLLESEGVGVELSRASYEAGDWASTVAEAYQKGRRAKEKKRQEGETGKRDAEGRQMALTLLDWLHQWRAKGTQAGAIQPAYANRL